MRGSIPVEWLGGSRFPGGDISAGIVVYVNSSGITAADRAKAQTDRRAFAAALMLDVGRVFWWPGRMARSTSASEPDSRPKACAPGGRTSPVPPADAGR
jgi:hypothetical protein